MSGCGKLQWAELASKGLHSDLSGGFDALPDAEVAEAPAGQETQSQLPSQTPQLLNAFRHSQHPTSAFQIDLGIITNKCCPG